MKNIITKDSYCQTDISLLDLEAMLNPFPSTSESSHVRCEDVEEDMSDDSISNDDDSGSDYELNTSDEEEMEEEEENDHDDETKGNHT